MTSEAARGAKSKLKQLVYEASTPARERTRQAIINDFLVVVRWNQLSDALLEMLILLKIFFNLRDISNR